jgi:hypothetical protein
MESTTMRLYSLDYKDVKTYLFATAFVAGNILLPQLAHLMPQGGLIFLPIYFFTLIAAYKYGWKVGLLTAVFSPVINSLLFGMHAIASLPIILIKSGLLAIGAGFAAHYFKRISIPILLGVILSYQVVGSIFEWALDGSFYSGVQDFRLGVPGMLLQVFGGYLFIKYLLKK